MNKSQVVQSGQKSGKEIVKVGLGDVFGHHCKFRPMWKWWSQWWEWWGYGENCDYDDKNYN